MNLHRSSGFSSVAFVGGNPLHRCYPVLKLLFVSPTLPPTLSNQPSLHTVPCLLVVIINASISMPFDPANTPSNSTSSPSAFLFSPQASFACASPLGRPPPLVFPLLSTFSSSSSHRLLVLLSLLPAYSEPSPHLSSSARTFLCTPTCEFKTWSCNLDSLWCVRALHLLDVVRIRSPDSESAACASRVEKPNPTGDDHKWRQ